MNSLYKENKVKLYGHYPVLVARVPYFAQQVDILDAVKGTVTVTFATSEIFLIFLRYIYTDKITGLNNINDLKEFMNLCDFYQLPSSYVLFFFPQCHFRIFLRCENMMDGFLD